MCGKGPWCTTCWIGLPPVLLWAHFDPKVSQCMRSVGNVWGVGECGGVSTWSWSWDLVDGGRPSPPCVPKAAARSLLPFCPHCTHPSTPLCTGACWTPSTVLASQIMHATRIMHASGCYLHPPAPAPFSQTHHVPHTRPHPSAGAGHHPQLWQLGLCAPEAAAPNRQGAGNCAERACLPVHTSQVGLRDQQECRSGEAGGSVCY